jgi:hypothetical protein
MISHISRITSGYVGFGGIRWCRIGSKYQLLEEHTSSTFRVDPENGGSTFLQNTGIHLQENTAPQTRRLQSEQSSKLKPENV